MTNLEQNGYTHDRIINIFNNTDVLKDSRFTLYIVRNKIPVKQLIPLSISIECDASRSIKYNAQFEFNNEDDIIWNTDRIQCYMTLYIDGILFEWAMCPPLRIGTRRKTIHTHNYITISVDAYDESSFLRDNSLPESLYIPAATPYISAIDDLFAYANFKEYNIFPTDKIIQTDREYSEGDKLLSIINELLEEINFLSLRSDKYGTLVSKEYKAPSPTDDTINFGIGANKFVQFPITISHDSYDKPNIFIGYVSNPDIDEPLRQEIVNDSPSSPLSTVNIGYRVTSDPKRYDNVADYQTLYDLVFKQKEETELSYHTVSFNTIILPMHEINDIISIDNDYVSGIFEEVYWSIDISSTSRNMSHIVRSLYGN